jgi:tetratricopeptide (TPR) repeat protein
VVISAIAGTAGVGKTALAVHWAHRVADRFPDGHIYINLRGFDPGRVVMEPAEAVRAFLDALGVPPQRIPATQTARVGLYRSLLADKRALLVLDNARDAEQVRPLLPGAPGCLVVVTSRNQLTSLVAVDGAHPLTVDLLPEAEARDLLIRRLGPERVAAEKAAVEGIIAHCAGLPLALLIVGARAAVEAHLPLSALAEELGNFRGRLDACSAGDVVSDVRAVFSWSYLALEPAAARLFRLLGLNPGPEISVPAAASLAGQPASEVEPLLADLARAHLLAELVPGRFAFHDLLRAYASEQAGAVETSRERHEAEQRMLDHYAHTGYAGALLLEPNCDPIPMTPPQPGATTSKLSDAAQAMTWFTVERPVLLAVIARAAADGFDTYPWRLAWTLWAWFERRGHHEDWARIQRTALAAAQRSGDPTGEAYAHRGLAAASTVLGRYDDAERHFRSALGKHAQAGERVGQARIHLNLCWLFDLQEQFGKALEHGQQGLRLFQDLDHPTGLTTALNLSGWCHARLGNHDEAIDHCRRALARHRERGDQRGAAHTLYVLGYSYHRLREYERAIASFQEALDLFRYLGDRYSEADTLGDLGDSREAVADPAAARAAWQEALDILEDLEHPDAERLRAKLQRR